MFHLFAKKDSTSKSLKDKLTILEETQQRLWEKSVDGEALNSLTPEEQVFFITAELEKEVNNGGFTQYLANSSGNHANHAPACFRAIGAEKTAAICQRVLSAFNMSLPESQAERLSFLHTALTETADATLEACDDLFYKYEDDLTELNYRYLISHKDAILK